MNKMRISLFKMSQNLHDTPKGKSNEIYLNCLTTSSVTQTRLKVKRKSQEVKKSIEHLFKNIFYKKKNSYLNESKKTKTRKENHTEFLGMKVLNLALYRAVIHCCLWPYLKGRCLACGRMTIHYYFGCKVRLCIRLHCRKINVGDECTIDEEIKCVDRNCSDSTIAMDF